MPAQANLQRPILLVDDEPEALQGCELMLRTGGLALCMRCQDSREVMPLLAGTEVSAVLLDLTMPHLSGETLLGTILGEYPELPVIIVTGANEVETAVRCMRAGAFDYIVKPMDENRLISSVRRAVEMSEVRLEYAHFKRRVLANELEYPEAFADIITQSPVMRSIFQYVETIARSPRPVLLSGETGVGKELIAQAVHRLSGRTGQFVAVNAAGLDDTMFADTLFGHVKGAYTGADESRPGLIARAQGGTLFLDEIGDLSPVSQMKLMRLLQDQEYFPLGTDVARRSDTRVVTATNRDLRALQAQGSFRADLYYRLHTHHVHIPPLRERIGDLPLLVDALLEKSSATLGKRKPTPPRELIPLLAVYPFPGNIRELESMIFDAVSHHDGHVLSLERFKTCVLNTPDLVSRPIQPSEDAPSPFAVFDTLPSLHEAKRLLTEEAMRRAQGNQSIAARMLGISQPGLSKALKRFTE
jgi:DNA-binding NtrC family response regulator